MVRIDSWIGAILWSAAALAPARSVDSVTELAVPVSVVEADSHHPGTLLAGTSAAQLFRSRDGGDSWTPLPFPVSLRATLHSVLIDPAAPGTYWAAVSSEETENAGVFCSRDEGATWHRGLEGRQVWALALWPGSSRVMAAGTAEGVFVTEDGAATWRHLGSANAVQPSPVTSLAFDPADRNTLYAGTPHLAWKTSDGGASWHRLSRGMEADSDIFSIDVDPNRRNRVFAGACSGIYRSINGGGTWVALERATGGPWRTYAIARAPGLAGVILVGTSGGVIRSSDGGATWRKLTVLPARSIAFDPADSRRVFVATDQGILLSDDGGTTFRGTTSGRAKR